MYTDLSVKDMAAGDLREFCIKVKPHHLNKLLNDTSAQRDEGSTYRIHILSLPFFPNRKLRIKSCNQDQGGLTIHNTQSNYRSLKKYKYTHNSVLRI